MLRIDFYRRLLSEESALQFAAELGLISLAREVCGYNGCNGVLNLEKGKSRHSVNARWRCNKRSCRRTKSIFTNTIFDGSKVSLVKYIEIIYSFCEQGTIEEKAQQLSIDRKNLSNIYKQIEVCMNSYYDEYEDTEKIGGDDNIVEMDETHLFTRMYQRGRTLRGQAYWILGAIDRTTKKIKIELTTRRNAQVINAFSANNIERSTTVITDEWKGYCNLRRNGYWHFTINHKRRFVDPNLRFVHTNTIERFWRTLKAAVSKNTRLLHLPAKLRILECKYNYRLKTTAQKLSVVVSAIKHYYSYSFYF
ncbi:hypothetical protein ENBRE01_2143 [Enteropsectra breve]|nr:hypothetical protein ENBRE01_2143 [Enteropsectra breve]